MSVSTSNRSRLEALENRQLLSTCTTPYTGQTSLISDFHIYGGFIKNFSLDSSVPPASLSSFTTPANPTEVPYALGDLESWLLPDSVPLKPIGFVGSYAFLWKYGNGETKFDVGFTLVAQQGQAGNPNAMTALISQGRHVGDRTQLPALNPGQITGYDLVSEFDPAMFSRFDPSLFSYYTPVAIELTASSSTIGFTPSATIDQFYDLRLKSTMTYAINACGDPGSESSLTVTVNQGPIYEYSTGAILGYMSFTGTAPIGLKGLPNSQAAANANMAAVFNG